MKNAKEYLDRANKPYINSPRMEDICVNEEAALRAIKQAQIDAIDTTVKMCSENADVDYNIIESFDRLMGDNIEVYIIKESILQVADKLKKELNGISK